MKRTTGPVFLVSATLLIVVVVLGWVYRTQAKKPADPQHVAAAEALLVQLSAPSGATLDQYATACGGRASFCVSAAKSSPEILLGTAVDQLRAAGAAVQQKACAAPGANTANTPRCSATLRYAGTDLNLQASDTTSLGYRTTPWLRVWVVDPNATATPSSPLGSWNGLAATPAAWQVDPTCRIGTPSRCNEFDQTNLSVPGNPKQASAALQSSLTAGGYRTDSLQCKAASASSKASCVVSASRFRSLGGLDGVIVSVTLTEVDATHSTVQLIAAPKPVS